MNTRSSLLCITFLAAATVGQASTLVCSASSSGIVELCDAGGVQVTIDLSQSGIPGSEIQSWAGQQFMLPTTTLNLFSQSIAFPVLAGQGFATSFTWGVGHQAGTTGALGIELDGKIGILGQLTGSAAQISGRIYVAPTTVGVHSFALGIVSTSAHSIPFAMLEPVAAPSPAFSLNTMLLVDPPINGTPLADVPEPATLALTSAALAALAVYRKR